VPCPSSVLYQRDLASLSQRYSTFGRRAGGEGKIDSLTIFYTQRLRGQLALLPPLQTFLRRLRGEHATAHPALLLDLGESCVPDVFPCALTGGRSSLIALDAMGYHAANVDGALADVDRAKLVEAHLQMGLVDTAHPYTTDDILCAIAPSSPADSIQLVIDLRAGSATELANGVLRLAAVDTAQVGMARISWRDGAAQVVAQGIFALPDDTLPDPVIAGTIGFILDEARYTQKRRGDKL
jgi:hypothetical protein